jgi:hypothetical protein
MELVDAVTTPSVGIGRKMLSRVVTSDSEKASAIDVLDPICKPEPGGGQGRNNNRPYNSALANF